MNVPPQHISVSEKFVHYAGSTATRLGKLYKDPDFLYHASMACFATLHLGFIHAPKSFARFASPKLLSTLDAVNHHSLYSVCRLPLNFFSRIHAGNIDINSLVNNVSLTITRQRGVQHIRGQILQATRVLINSMRANHDVYALDSEFIEILTNTLQNQGVDLTGVDLTGLQIPLHRNYDLGAKLSSIGFALIDIQASILALKQFKLIDTVQILNQVERYTNVKWIQKTDLALGLHITLVATFALKTFEAARKLYSGQSEQKWELATSATELAVNTLALIDHFEVIKINPTIVYGGILVARVASLANLILHS